MLECPHIKVKVRLIIPCEAWGCGLTHVFSLVGSVLSLVGSGGIRPCRVAWSSSVSFLAAARGGTDVLLKTVVHGLKKMQ